MPTKSISFTYPQFASNGRIRAIALQQIIDGSSIYVPNRDVASGTFNGAGVATVALPVPSAGEVAYRFVLESGVSPNFTEVDRFDRGINTNSPTDGSQLQDAFFPVDIADQSLYTIAQILSTNPQFLTAVPGFTEKTWAAATIFQLGEYTWRGDGLYRSISPTAQSNKDPLVAANVSPAPGAVWEKKLTVPQGPAGTTPSRSYDSTVFETLPTEPASRKNLNELRATIATPDLSGYAQRSAAQTWTAKQSFGAGASGVTATAGTNNTDLATNAFVQAAVSAISGSGTLPEPVFWSRRSADLSPSANARPVITWDSTVKGTHSSGVITIPSSGFYLAIAQLTFALGSTFSAAGGRLFARAMIFINDSEASDLIALNVNENNGSQQWRLTGIKPFSATGGDRFDLRFTWGSSNAGGSPSGKIEGSIPNNYLMLFKMAG